MKAWGTILAAQNHKKPSLLFSAISTHTKAAAHAQRGTKLWQPR